MRTLILDLGSSVSETYGDQEGSVYNGHFGCECYHPLFCFNQFGDVERALLRNGNVASADDWRSVLMPVIARYVTFQLAEVAVPRSLIAAILERVRRFAAAAPRAGPA